MTRPVITGRRAVHLRALGGSVSNWLTVAMMLAFVLAVIVLTRPLR